jgi:predicted DNA-binding protein (UPF0251 family)
LAAKGATVNTIAAALDVTWKTAHEALEFGRTGRRPEVRRRSRGPKRRVVKRHAVDETEVIRLRDECRLSFEAIARRLDTGTEAVVRAYDRGKPQAVQDAAESGRRPWRGRYSTLAPEVFVRIKAGLEAGQPCADIAADTGCCVATVYRIQAQLRADAA